MSKQETTNKIESLKEQTYTMAVLAVSDFNDKDILQKLALHHRTEHTHI